METPYCPDCLAIQADADDSSSSLHCPGCVNKFLLVAFAAGFEMGKSGLHKTSTEAWQVLEAKKKPTS